MKKILLLALLALISFTGYSQDITGTWLGTATIGEHELRIVFHFEHDGTAYTGKMDSPDQGARGIPVTKVEFEAPELTVEMPAIAFVYKGTLEEGDVIKGSFTQGGMTFPLDLTRGEIVVNRPQTPLPPYPYNTEDVRFDNKEAGVTLAGTLTTPKDNGRHPAVILVTGSGAQNRDEEILDHKPFLVIADHLTRNGIAALRYDDRGFAESTGTFAGSTTLDFTGDALAAFDYLKTRSEINPRQIGIIGHSEGGTIAFMAAARQPETGFIISLAGSILPMDSTLVLQNRYLLLNEGFDEMVADDYSMALRDVLGFKKRFDADYLSANAEEFSDVIDSYTSLPGFLRDNLKIILTMSDPWLDFSIKYDPTRDIENTKCSVFALNGDKDIQVEHSSNLGYLEQVMERVGNSNYKVKTYPELNHLFQECSTGGVAEYAEIEQTISPVVLDDITEWIKEITK